VAELLQAGCPSCPTNSIKVLKDINFKVPFIETNLCILQTECCTWHYYYSCRINAL